MDKYKPTQGEITAAEEAMTPVQKDLSKFRERKSKYSGGEKIEVVGYEKQDIYKRHRTTIRVKGHMVELLEKFSKQDGDSSYEVTVDGHDLDKEDKKRFLEKYLPIIEAQKAALGNDLEQIRHEENYAQQEHKEMRHKENIKDLLD